MFGSAKSGMPSLLGGSASSSEQAGEVVLGFATAGSDVAKNPCPCCVLTFKQRLMGFVTCFSVGMLVSFIATFKLYSGDMVGFATLYSIGNIVALFSTGFLVGAWRGAPAAAVAAATPLLAPRAYPRSRRDIPRCALPSRAQPRAPPLQLPQARCRS